MKEIFNVCQDTLVLMMAPVIDRKDTIIIIIGRSYLRRLSFNIPLCDHAVIILDIIHLREAALLPHRPQLTHTWLQKPRFLVAPSLPSSRISIFHQVGTSFTVAVLCTLNLE